MDREQFLSAATMPGFGDEMDFVLRRHMDDGMTFSYEAVEAVAATVHDFVMASVLRRWRETGEPPQGLTTRIKLDWDGPSDERMEEGPRPWWGLDDKGGAIIPLDGSFRTQAWTRRRG